MANILEATANVGFRPEQRKALLTGDLNMLFQPATKNYIDNIQNIGIVEEAINVGDVGTVGLIVLINIDNTNYIEVGLTGSYSIKLKPGQFAVFPPNGTLYALANTAAADLHVYAFPSV